MGIHIRFEYKENRLDKRYIRRFLNRLMQDMNLNEYELSVLFVSDEKMRELNRDYRNIDRSTDVLSFPQSWDLPDADHPGQHILGDIVIAVDFAARQAEEKGHHIEKEVRKLLVHGFLHLLGMDHSTSKEARKMQSMEKRILSSAASRSRRVYDV